MTVLVIVVNYYSYIVVVATESMNWGTELWVSLADQNFIFPPEKLLYITSPSPAQLHFAISSKQPV
jgi:hypothetical protein